MRRLVSLLVAFVLLLAALPAATAEDATPAAMPPLPPLSANASVFATGLDSPRGLEFGPDGALYVAEAGTGGSVSTVGQCEQVPPPVGPYTGGTTGRVSKIDATGQRSTVAEGLPSDQTSAALGSEPAGVAAVAWGDGKLFSLVAGGGCSHGNPASPNGVYAIGEDGKPKLVADLTAWVRAHPTKQPNPGDFEPDGSPYGMALAGGKLYVVEANHGAVDAVDAATGAVSRVVDISATRGHIVPASIATGPDGTLYVGNLTTLPYLDGSAVVLRIAPDGTLSTYAEGLTTVLGLAWVGNDLYALESTTANLAQPPFVHPGSGKVVRVVPGGTPETVATGLNFPTGMTLGPDGALYVANNGFGFGPAAGKGEIVRVTLPAATATPAP